MLILWFCFVDSIATFFGEEKICWLSGLWGRVLGEGIGYVGEGLGCFVLGDRVSDCRFYSD